MTAAVIMLYFAALGLPENHVLALTDSGVYWELPHFWSNVGFCPAGRTQRDIVESLLHSDAMQLNMRHIAALPDGAVTHIRIHWLLQLLHFEQYTQAGLPMFDFTHLDEFMYTLHDYGLHPVVEFMGNPGGIFIKNPTQNAVLWENFVYQVVRRYLNLLGAKELLNWRFETWNEPDLPVYNRLNFTATSYLEYVLSVQKGLAAAGHRDDGNSLHFPLRGPAGLFKEAGLHPLCWGLLSYCDTHPVSCPIEVLTYHRKGNGTTQNILDTSLELLHTIHAQYPALEAMPISNDEADPIATWSTPHAYHEDVRYAAMVVDIVLDHWNAKLQSKYMQRLESISHDNAFLSYHPHEFAQRTLLAHFRMNTSTPVHSQFVQKPVYAALGLLAKLGDLAAYVEHISLPNCAPIRRLRTTSKTDASYMSWLLVSTATSKTATAKCNITQFAMHLPPIDLANTHYAYIMETLEAQHTDPAFVWHSNGSPAYPDARLRMAMRRQQTPALLAMGPLTTAQQYIQFNMKALNTPWIILMRMCANTTAVPHAPQKVTATTVTRGEVLLTWRETKSATICLQNYEAWHCSENADSWSHISSGWRVTFPSFHYAANSGDANGFYKVRSVDIFNRSSAFSETFEYIEL